ncbi:MAG: hypothetical protein AB7O87_09090 [Candidatus Nitrosocosmicus sp.]
MYFQYLGPEHLPYTSGLGLISTETFAKTTILLFEVYDVSLEKDNRISKDKTKIVLIADFMMF